MSGESALWLRVNLARSVGGSVAFRGRRVRAYRRLDPEHSAGRPADSYSAALTMDVGTLEPRRAGSGLPPAAHRRDTEAMRGSCHTLLL